MTTVRGGVIILSQISKKLMLAIWTAAHSDELLRTLPFCWAMRSNGYGGMS
jgi:hypothetical protein